MSEKKPVYSQGKFDPNHPLISQSFLNMWAACPLAAKFRYIDGIIDPPGIAALQGSATDAAVTLGAETVIKTGADASLSNKKEMAAATFDKKLPETKVLSDDDVGAAKDETISLVELHHKEIAPTLKPVMAQEAILVKSETFDIAGTLDLVEENHVISDTKTANRRGKYSVSESIQATLYTVLYHNKYGVEPTKFRFDALIKNKKPVIERTEGVVTDMQRRLLGYQIETAMAELKSSLQTGMFRIAEPGHWRCESTGKWCAYLSACPKGKKS